MTRMASTIGPVFLICVFPCVACAASGEVMTTLAGALDGALKGALIGGLIGGCVGLIMQLAKKRQTPPADKNDDDDAKE